MSAKKELIENFQNEDIYKITLKTESMTVQILSYGATIHKLIYKDKDLVLGFNSINEYAKSTTYCGAVIGRISNRLGDGKALIDGEIYELAKNDNGVSHLHGGIKGYKDTVWNIDSISDTDEPSVTFSIVDEDGNQNYPGTVNVKVTYTLTKNNELKLDYYAVTDKTTVVNMTNHSYFNLNGYDGNTITEHELYINADYYTPIDEYLIPTGEIKSVKGTPFDFTTSKKLSKDIEADDKDIKFAGGFDHNFVLNSADIKKPAACAKGDKSGIKMYVYTTMPGLQFYSGNFIKDNEINKNGKPLTKRCGFCLETQFFPDAPNKPMFPSCELKPGEVYDNTTIFRFE